MNKSIFAYNVVVPGTRAFISLSINLVVPICIVQGARCALPPIVSMNS